MLERGLFHPSLGQAEDVRLVRLQLPGVAVERLRSMQDAVR